MYNLIHPSDYWILFVSVFVVILFAVKQLRALAYLGVVITSVVVFKHYGAGRLVIHVGLFFIDVWVVRKLMSLGKREVAKEN